MTNIFGIIGGILGISSQIPQLIKSLRTKETKDLSKRTYIMLIACNALWIAHGFARGDMVIAITNSIAIIFPIGVLIAKLKYG